MNKEKKIQKKAVDLKKEVLNHDRASIISHIDTDGLCASAILSKTLNRAGIEHDVTHLKSLDKDKLDEIKKKNSSLLIFSDLGSGGIKEIKKLPQSSIILDHHEPVIKEKKIGNTYQLNPHLFGVDGATELSGSGTAFFFSRTFNNKNDDLSALAIIGGIGDLQDSKFGRLKGLNRKILDIGSKKNVIDYKKDIKMFGKQTKPVHKLLEYASDPYIPGISGNRRESIELLKELDIPLKNDDRWRRWIDLSKKEKKKIISKLMRYCLVNGVPKEEIERMIGEVYILLNEKEGTELRDASEFSTLLNATARYNEAEIGLKICLGDRGEYYKKAKKLLKNHRKNIIEGLNLVKNNGVKELSELQYFHGENKIKDTIVGIIAGMAYNTPNLTREKPVIAFARKNSEEVKVSARATQKHIRNGINLGKIIREVSEKVAGSGGGHDIAAGATIPKGKEEKFLRKLNTKLQKQAG